MSSVCRVCLAGITKLNCLNNKVLIDVFEKLSDTKFYSEDARPRALCHICYRKLQICLTFTQMAHRSEKIFSQLFHEGLEASSEDITKLNLGVEQHLSAANTQLTMDNTSDEGSHMTFEDEPISTKKEATQQYITEANLGMKQKVLSMATMQFITIDDNTTNAGSQITIKDEPVPSTNIKEVTTELDELAEVKSVLPEYSIKSRLTFEEDSDQEDDVEELPPDSHDEQTKANDSNNMLLWKQLACNVCDKQFNHRSNLGRHMLTHTGEKPFACNVCDKKFNHKSTLVYHMRTHTGDKSFACNICDKQFNSKAVLVQHMKTHTGEKPFFCNVCYKQYKNKGNLVCHLRTHTEAKPFACKICDKQFTSKHYSVVHMRSHTGEKPFACNVCDKQFTTKNTLVIHHNNKHRSEAISQQCM